MEDQQILNLELTVAEINVILRSLSKHPFEEIATLIQKIKSQGESQLQQQVNDQVEEPKVEEITD